MGGNRRQGFGDVADAQRGVWMNREAAGLSAIAKDSTRGKQRGPSREGSSPDGRDAFGGSGALAPRARSRQGRARISTASLYDPSAYYRVALSGYQ